MKNIDLAETNATYIEYAYNNGFEAGKEELSKEVKDLISQMRKDNFSSEKILTEVINKVSEIKD